MINETELCKLAFKYKTDKCIRCGGRHSYTPYYYSLFKDKKYLIKKLLEIGIGEGGSLYMWRDFFPNAQIFGVDYRSESLIKDRRIDSILCDQRRSEHLVHLIDYIGPNLDIVIDDGSHRPRDQVYTCLKLMPLLHKEAIYIIEDVSDLGIIEGLKMFNVEVPKVDRARNRYDNRLVIIKYKAVI
jgi:hypothetical protein